MNSSMPNEFVRHIVQYRHAEAPTIKECLEMLLSHLDGFQLVVQQSFHMPEHSDGVSAVAVPYQLALAVTAGM